jgi:hypothetical protein
VDQILDLLGQLPRTCTRSCWPRPPWCWATRLLDAPAQQTSPEQLADDGQLLLAHYQYHHVDLPWLGLELSAS